jgi:hypothetical protein
MRGASRFRFSKTALSGIEGSIFLEFVVPRIGSRIDAVLISGPVLFVIEFKVGAEAFSRDDLNQVWDYALDVYASSSRPKVSGVRGKFTMAQPRRTATRPFVGQWRIMKMDLWSTEDLDLLGPAHLTLEHDGLGRLEFLAIEADVDYRVVQRDSLPAVEFSFEGSDEGDRISGRGWAILDGEQLRDRLFLHRGDDSGFAARRDR